MLDFHRQLGLTTILVSHDPVEIYQLADYALELDHGRLVRQGPPWDLASTTAQHGEIVLHGRVLSVAQRDNAYLVQVQTEGQVVTGVVPAQEARKLAAGDRVRLTARISNPVITRAD